MSLSGPPPQTAIARALIENPDLLIMDEPFGSLDPQSRNEMHEILKEVSAQNEVAILFVTHNILEAFDLSNRIILLQGGHEKGGRILDEFRIPEAREIAEKAIVKLFGLSRISI